MAAVLAVREGCAAESARERRRRNCEVADEQRFQAFLWRQRREQQRSEMERSKAAAGSKAGRVAGSVINSEKHGRSARRTDGLRFAGATTLSYTEDDEDSSGEERQKNPGTELLRAALVNRVQARRLHSQKLARLKKSRAVRTGELPVAEREAQERSFRIYADPATLMLPAEDLLRCLLELGLAGSTRHERWAVEKMVCNVYFALVGECTLEEIGEQSKAPKEPPRMVSVSGVPGQRAERQSTLHKTHGTQRSGSMWRTNGGGSSAAPAIAEALRRAAAQAQRSGRGTDGFSRHNIRLSVRTSAGHCGIIGPKPVKATKVPICFEDFSAEVVPAVRRQLDDIRQEAHFGEFIKVVSRCSQDTVALRPAQFFAVAERLSLYPDISKAALEEADVLTCAEMLGEGASGGDPNEACLDHDTFHDILMVAEERTARRKRRLEHEVREKTGMPDSTFWQYRHELLQLHDAFGMYDEDEDEALSRGEVKQLLKHIGFEPYRKGAEADMVNDLLDEIEANSIEKVDIFEFLQLLDSIRDWHRSSRREGLVGIFRSRDRDGGRSLDFKHVWRMFRELGLQVPEEDEDAAKRVVDDFDTECSGQISLVEFEDLTQRLIETLRSRAAMRCIQEAQALGITLDVLAEYQWAFDQLDVDKSGGLSVTEIREALSMQMARMPTEDELQLLYKEITRDMDSEILQMADFLHLMKAASDTLFRVGKPFALHDVPVKQLRECLLCFPLAEDYVLKLTHEELLELVASYLDVKPGTNLRVHEGVSNARQLLEFAGQKAELEHGTARGMRAR